MVNVAARLQAKAQAGKVIACERIVEKGRDLVPEGYAVEKALLELMGKEDVYSTWVLRPRAPAGYLTKVRM